MKTRYDIYEIPVDRQNDTRDYLNDCLRGFDYPIAFRGNAYLTETHKDIFDEIDYNIRTALDNYDYEEVG